MRVGGEATKFSATSLHVPLLSCLCGLIPPKIPRERQEKKGQSTSILSVVPRGGKGGAGGTLVQESPESLLSLNMQKNKGRCSANAIPLSFPPPQYPICRVRAPLSPTSHHLRCSLMRIPMSQVQSELSHTPIPPFSLCQEEKAHPSPPPAERWRGKSFPID